MPIAKNTGGDFTPAPAGTHLARCIGVVSLGTQTPTNPTFSPTFKIMLVWELPEEIMEGGKAMTISKEFTCSLSEKSNLRPLLESWRGRPFTAKELEGFDVADVLDAPCLVSIIHKQSAKGKTYANVSSVAKLPKTMKAMDRVNELVHYEIEQGKDKVYDSLPEWIRKKIAACTEWIAHPEPPSHSSEESPDAEPEYDPSLPPDEEVPF